MELLSEGNKEHPAHFGNAATASTSFLEAAEISFAAAATAASSLARRACFSRLYDIISTVNACQHAARSKTHHAKRAGTGRGGWSGEPPPVSLNTHDGPARPVEIAHNCCERCCSCSSTHPPCQHTHLINIKSEQLGSL